MRWTRRRDPAISAIDLPGKRGCERTDSRIFQCYFQDFGPEIGDLRVFTGFDEEFFVRSIVDVDNSQGLPASLRASQGLVASGAGVDLSLRRGGSHNALRESGRNARSDRG
jgi:hypothetical protein